MANYRMSVSIVGCLKQEILWHNHLYYGKDDPTISDYSYDMLIKALEYLEKAYPELLTEDSPTQVVGCDPYPDK